MKIFDYTVTRLHKELGRIIAEGGGRSPVCVDKPTFSHNLEGDGAVILNVSGLRAEPVPQIDDDGGMKTTKKGATVYRQCVVLHGHAYDPNQNTKE